MSSHPSLRNLYDFSGWVVQQIQVTPTIAVVKLHRDKRLNIYCPHCIRKASVNKKVMQSAYDLPIGPVSLVQVLYEALQGYCSGCKSYFTLHPPGIDSYAHATKRLMHYVCRLCRYMPVNKVPVFLPISASTARRWDKRILARHLPDPDLDDLRVILIDEKSIGAGHQYMTVVINGETGEVLHLAEGRKKLRWNHFSRNLPQNRSRNSKPLVSTVPEHIKALSGNMHQRHKSFLINSISSATSTPPSMRYADQNGAKLARKTNSASKGSALIFFATATSSRIISAMT